MAGRNAILRRVKTPAFIAGGYGLVFAIIFLMDLYTGWKGPWSFFVLAMTYPWSVLLMYAAAWSMAHSGYPVDCFFIPGALINCFGIFWLAKQARLKPH